VTGSSLATLLVLAFTAAVSPFSLIVFSLVLASDRGARNGFAFICGWIITVVLIGVVMITIGDAADVPTSQSPRKWFLALQLALGTILVIMFVRRRLRAKPIEEPVAAAPAKPQPGWQRRIATMRAPGAMILGGATQTWPVMIAAGAELARLDIPHDEAVLWMVLFAIATTAGIVVLEILAIRSPGTAASRLDRIRAYVDNHRDSVINWAYLFGGLFLVYRGLIGLL
jgi:threonine/homoserine/homoserine lactone efflux protein